MELNLVAEGAKFMIFGMSVVFLFLVMMVLVLNMQGRLLTKYFPPKPKSAPAPTGGRPAQMNPETLKAVVAAAIGEYKKDKSKA